MSTLRVVEWCDAHIDLAYLQLAGRDLTAPLDRAVGDPQPAAVTLPSLAEGRVRWVFATVFTGRGYAGPGGYESLDEARASAVAQLDVYERLQEAGHLRIVREEPDLDEPGLGVVLLMEGGDPIRDADDVAWWCDRGVHVVGLSWATGSRFSGGNARHGPLTAEGRDVVSALDAAGVIHDLSHLSDQAAQDLLGQTAGPVIASHSNARVLVDPDNQRHLSDELIAAVGERGGVVGLNLYSRFLTRDGARATIEQTAAHVLHVAEVMGRRDGVGLGSDMDGGFGADALPVGIDTPAGLGLLAGALEQAGWSRQEVEGFASGNWLRCVRRALRDRFPPARA